jgi:hypothetical protein
MAARLSALLAAALYSRKILDTYFCYRLSHSRAILRLKELGQLEKQWSHQESNTQPSGL